MKIKSMKNRSKDISKLFKSRKIEVGDFVYNKIPLDNKFDEFHVFKVVKKNKETVDIKSFRNGEVVCNVEMNSLKRSDIMNKN